MKVIGRKTELTVKEHFTIPMATSLEEILFKTISMATEYMNIWTVQDTRENGKTINKKDSEQKVGKMDLNMRVISSKEKNTDKVDIFGATELNTMEIGKKTKLLDLEYMNGLMGENMRENG